MPLLNAPDIGNLFCAEGTLSVAVGAALLGERNAFALTLAQQGTLELRECSHHRQHEVGRRRIITGEFQTLLNERDAHPPAVWSAS